MKKVLFLFLIISNYISSAQNYQCLQSGQPHYFLNGNGYLRGIRVDSVKTFADSTVYYPNHTPRGVYNVSDPRPILDTNGGSWLGKTVIRLNDGTFIFDSYWNDSVIIKTQAKPGDSWVFYSDTSSLYYTATVVSIDTMTVSGSIDSVKTMMINANNASGIVSADPLNGFTIILSKNNGFVQVFDLYTFPYHKPDSTYRPGLDFFLDRSTCDYFKVNDAIGFSPNTSISLFKLIDFINPTDQQLHNWNMGDVLGSYHMFSNYPVTMPGSGGVWYTNYLMDTVTAKITAGHAINYTLSGNSSSCSFPSDPCDLFLKAGTYTFYDNVYPFAPASYIPEENLHLRSYIFYFPEDTTHCVVSPEYVVLGVSFLAEDAAPVYYKLGIGETSFSVADDDDFIWESGAVTYTNIAGNSCGPLSVNKVSVLPDEIGIYPNPATNELTVKTGYQQSYTITVLDVMGQMIRSIKTDKQEETINVSNIPAGVYNICVSSEDGGRINNKVVVVH